MKIPPRSTRKLTLAASMIAAALGGLMAMAPPAQAAGKTLYLFNWQDYIGKGLIKKYEAHCGCKVVQTYYDSNSALAAKLKAGGDSQFDVVVPSSYYVPQLIHEGLITKLNKAEIPNFRNLAAQFKNPTYDPHDDYSMPYQWGTTGIGYLKTKIASLPESWAVLFDPKLNPDYPFALMGGSGRDTMGAACAYLGYGFTCNKKSQWIKAAKLIEKTEKRKNFTGFVDGDPAMGQIKKGTIAIGMTFNGDVAECYDDKSCLNSGYLLPKQGTEIWVDTMAIPKHAPDPKLGYDFINFILSAKAGAELSNFNLYGSPNAAAGPMLSKELKTPLIKPTSAQMKYLHFLPPLAGTKLQTFNAIWTAVRQH
ncbi:MAG: spermidine/putrescine ABC transporter substrate-binding protein [Acidiphilium sp.]|nr:spermidine/putrescine ABC transporter substrate-binding protein [Acidiphilium sp.]